MNRPTFSCRDDAQPEVVPLEVSPEFHHLPWHFQVFGTSETQAHDVFQHKSRHPLGLRLYFWQQPPSRDMERDLRLPACYFLVTGTKSEQKIKPDLTPFV